MLKGADKHEEGEKKKGLTGVRGAPSARKTKLISEGAKFKNTLPSGLGS